MEISIIILNYKSEHHLENCIASLQKNLFGISHEIIIINNDSASIKVLAPTENLHIINNKKNDGFAKACNKGAAIAHGKILLFLNPDTKLLSGNVMDLIMAFHDPSVGVVSPQLITTWGEVQEWSVGYELTLAEILRNNLGFVRSKKLWKKDVATQPDWTSGAALAITKDLFEEIEGFDEKFFMYFEDVDLCKRVREKSLKIITLPTIKVLHLCGQSSSSATQQKNYYYASQDYYFKKHFGRFHLFFLKLFRAGALFFKK